MRRMKEILATLGQTDPKLLLAMASFPLAALALLLKWVIYRGDKSRGNLELLALAMKRDFSDAKPEDIILMEETLFHYYKVRISNSVYQILRTAPNRSQALGYWRRIFHVFEPTKAGTMLKYVSGNWLTRSKKLRRVSIAVWVLVNVGAGFILIYVGLFLLAVAWKATMFIPASTVQVQLASVAVLLMVFGAMLCLVAYFLFGRGVDVWLYRKDFIEAIGPLFENAGDRIQ